MGKPKVPQDEEMTRPTGSGGVLQTENGTPQARTMLCVVLLQHFFFPFFPFPIAMEQYLETG